MNLDTPAAAPRRARKSLLPREVPREDWERVLGGPVPDLPTGATGMTVRTLAPRVTIISIFKPDEAACVEALQIVLDAGGIS